MTVQRLVSWLDSTGGSRRWTLCHPQRYCFWPRHVPPAVTDEAQVERWDMVWFLQRRRREFLVLQTHYLSAAFV